MAVSIKRITVWRAKARHKPGVLASVLEPLAQAGANFRVMMGYGENGGATIEVFPVSGARVTSAARGAGLAASPTPCVLVEGDDRAGLGADMARAIGKARVNISFVVAQTVGRKFSAMFGFRTERAAAKASQAIKSAARRRKR